ncbi:hypothetical protein HDU79_007816 [Rhizoclosmatium sp. JEL0117]|nr:hypothetical protein HDU79_007816 [Rhizoclosmatium sp. JEL0117]
MASPPPPIGPTQTSATHFDTMADVVRTAPQQQHRYQKHRSSSLNHVHATNPNSKDPTHRTRQPNTNTNHNQGLRNSIHHHHHQQRPNRSATVVLTPLLPPPSRRRYENHHASSASRPPAVTSSTTSTTTANKPNILDRLGPPIQTSSNLLPLRNPRPNWVNRDTAQTAPSQALDSIHPPSSSSAITASSPLQRPPRKHKKRKNNKNKHSHHAHRQPSTSSLLVDPLSTDPATDSSLFELGQLSPTSARRRRKKQLLANHNSIQAAKRRARNAIAASSATGVGGSSSNNTAVDPTTGAPIGLDLGRDAFMELMREAGLGSRSFRIVTREDLLYGNSPTPSSPHNPQGDGDGDGDGGEQEYDSEYDPALDGVHSEVSYAYSDWGDDGNDNDQKESGGDSMEDDDDDLDAGAPREAFSTSEEDEFDFSDLDLEIDAALASLGVTQQPMESSSSSSNSSNSGSSSGSTQSGSTSDDGDDHLEEGPKVLMQVFGEDGQLVFKSPMVVFGDSRSGETVYRPLESVKVSGRTPKASPALAVPTIVRTVAEEDEVGDAMEL